MSSVKKLTYIAKKIKESGFMPTLKRFIQTNEVKFGREVGQDQFGNKYFVEDDPEYWGRERWVEFSKDNEASAVPAEWHSWLHHSSDEMPTDKQSRIAQITPTYKKDHSENLTGTDQAYSPPTWVGAKFYRPASEGKTSWDPNDVNSNKKPLSDL
jgi:NADH:ubiquinone oxidoreductase subunit